MEDGGQIIFNAGAEMKRGAVGEVAAGGGAGTGWDGDGVRGGEAGDVERGVHG